MKTKVGMRFFLFFICNFKRIGNLYPQPTLLLIITFLMFKLLLKCAINKNHSGTPIISTKKCLTKSMTNFRQPRFLMFDIVYDNESVADETLLYF